MKVQSLFDEKDYYSYTLHDESTNRAKITGTIVEYSIDTSLSPFVAEKPGWEAFQILKERFGLILWSYLMMKWNRLFNAQDVMVNPNKTYNDLKVCLQTIEQHVGTFTVDNLLAFILHFNAQHSYQEIVNALESRIAIDKKTTVLSKDVLELISRHTASQTDIPSSALLSYSTRPTRTNANNNTEHLTTYMNRSDEWARTWLTFHHLCSYCFEWGHWAVDCPRKKAQLPALRDPRANDWSVCIKQSNVCHPVFRKGSVPQVSSTSNNSGEGNSVLLDLGATDSVTNNTNFP